MLRSLKSTHILQVLSHSRTIKGLPTEVLYRTSLRITSSLYQLSTSSHVALLLSGANPLSRSGANPLFLWTIAPFPFCIPNRCFDTSIGTPIISDGFHANTLQLFSDKLINFFFPSFIMAQASPIVIAWSENYGFMDILY